MISNYNRIVILGSPGSGKTYLAKLISKITGIPAYHTDYIRRGESWYDKSVLEIQEGFNAILSTATWIIEGNCSVCLTERIQKADLIIVFKFSKMRVITNVFIRMIKNLGKTIPECPQCKEHINLEFLKYTWDFSYKRQPDIETIIEQNCKGDLVCFSNWRMYKQQFRGDKIDQ